MYSVVEVTENIDLVFEMWAMRCCSMVLIVCFWAAALDEDGVQTTNQPETWNETLPNKVRIMVGFW